MATSNSNLRGSVSVVLAMAEAIRELGSVPAGTLYAQLCGKLDLPSFEAIIRTLSNAGLVKKSGDVLYWVGPGTAERRTQ